MADNNKSYKEAMDNIHAPDSLVEKTLKLMNEKLEAMDSDEEDPAIPLESELRRKKRIISITRMSLIVVAAAACILVILGGRQLFSQINGVVTVDPVISIYSNPDNTDSDKDITPTHQHVWKEATCTEPKTCTVCGETYGEALGHDWASATYNQPQQCRRCGLISGSPLTIVTPTATPTPAATQRVTPTATATATPTHQHVWKAATCTEPRTCTICGEKEGKALGHNWVHTGEDKSKVVCTRCGDTGFIAYAPPPSTPNNHTNIYVTKFGKFYHAKSTCSGMTGATEVTLEAAIKTGKKACPVCFKADNVNVFTTDTGEYYHTNSNCSGMRFAISVTVAEAKNAGKTACPICAEQLGILFDKATINSTNTDTNNESDSTSANIIVHDKLIQYGVYEQDGDISNGKEPIDWIVLDMSQSVTNFSG